MNPVIWQSQVSHAAVHWMIYARHEVPAASRNSATPEICQPRVAWRTVADSRPSISSLRQTTVGRDGIRACYRLGPERRRERGMVMIVTACDDLAVRNRECLNAVDDESASGARRQSVVRVFRDDERIER